MRILPTLLATCALATISFAQDDTVKVVKSAPIQFEAVKSGQFHSTETAIEVKGDFDAQFTHPRCGEKELGEKAGCTTQALLDDIKTNLTYNPAEADRPVEKDKAVDISFSINEFGNVKSIRVEYTGDPRIAQSIIQALYSVPRMIPAKKEGKSVPSFVKMAVSYETIFGK